MRIALNPLTLLLVTSLHFTACVPAPTTPGNNNTTHDLSVSENSDGPQSSDLSIRPDLTPTCPACVAPTPVCDTQARRCVACLSDPDCPAGFVCMNKACMPGCSPNHPQCGDAGTCDVDAGACHGCLGNKDCVDPNKPFCDLPTGQCGPCVPQNDLCPPGQYCGPLKNGLGCVPGCKADIECQTADGGGAGTLCCNHLCVDTGASDKNCGACGMACQGTTCCSGRCADTKRDVSNCGMCSVVCGGRNIIPACMNGVCGSAGCVMGFADCDKNPQNGCEASTDSDTNNCGACGKQCVAQNAGTLCLAGSCSIAACNTGYRDCNSNYADGCEINVLVDPLNCGNCGNSCANLPHAAAGCKNGVCAIGMCAPGYGNCDGNDGNGCESKLDSDPLNCGACAKPCPGPANVQTFCMNTQCSTGGCNLGFADCNMNMADGCEANLNTDPKNCSACNMACAAVANGAPGCAKGVCGVGTCNLSFADCDKNVANGCEVNTNTDNANCGGCGTLCAMGKMCVSGSCKSPGILVGMLGNQSFWKVQVMGAMTDTNVYAVCQAAGMSVGCQAAGNCNYNDNKCVMTAENSCGNPMLTLSTKVCGGAPSSCAALYGAFQYMGHNWSNDSACGAEQGQWCVTGNQVQNRFALCVQ